jgi:hypothetical protein
MILLGSHFVGNNTAELVLFLLLKTAADVAMHVLEHSLTWSGGARTTRTRS